jgi:alkylhydroperoxidase family enzyme
MTPYLAPIDKPKGLRLRLLGIALRRMMPKTPGWFTVFSSRMPFAFTMWIGKAGQLNKKLTIAPDTSALIRARVDDLNTCTHCADAGRWYITEKQPHLLPKLDVLHDYRSSPLLSEHERAALDFASELTEHKHISPDTFAVLSRHYSEREICEIVWVVSSSHLTNINNLGLGIGSDDLCELAKRKQAGADLTAIAD